MQDSDYSPFQNVIYISFRFHSFHKLGNDKTKAVFFTKSFIVETMLTSCLISYIP